MQALLTQKSQTLNMVPHYLPEAYTVNLVLDTGMLWLICVGRLSLRRDVTTCSAFRQTMLRHSFSMLTIPYPYLDLD